MIYHDGMDDLEGLAEVVDSTSHDLLYEFNKGNFDALAVTGMSGVVVGIPVSLKTGIPVIVVRKEDDDSHSGAKFINRHLISEGTRLLFLDDFVDGGFTRDFITNRIEYCGGILVGQYLYKRAILEYEDDLDKEVSH